jgi:SecD/SecF fusion protein
LRQRSYLFLFIVVALGVLSAYLYTIRPYKYGLDVKGGVRFTYQMDLSKLSPEQKTSMSTIRNQVQTILVNRATGSFGVAEPSVVPKGEDQFIIELPGFTNIDQAREGIGSSARIELYDAANVDTQRFNFRAYKVADENKNPLNPSVSFIRKSDNKVIEPGTPEYEQMIKGWTLILSGDDLKSAEAQSSGSGYQPLMHFSIKGSDKMSTWSRKHQTDRENIAAVLDGKVLSIAGLVENTVLSDNAVITGTFETAYVTKLVELLNAGALPVDLKELSSEKVDPTIGAQALDKIVTAGVISFGVIALFLIGYYAFPGFVALIALLLYVLFTLTTLKLVGATFSLAAIAGFILSVGMAVDANILVFERFKEEIKLGKSLATSVELGFRRALPAIFDSNACTILTSLVLAYFGTGPVKGFATSLIIGVLISLFTAVTVTRSLLMFAIGAGFGNNAKLYALERNWLGKKFEERASTDPLPVVQKSTKWFLISLVTIVVGIPFMFMGGLKGNVEFRGGYSAQYGATGQTVNPSDVVSKLEQGGIRGANVKFGGEGAARFAEITAPSDGALKGLSEKDAIAKITQVAGFNAADLKGSSSVGPAIQAETIRNAVMGVLISSALIIVYLAMRFGFGLGGFASGLRFGVSAIGALAHDVLVVLGVTAAVGFFFNWEISALFITSMLTVIGFSVHDTIVIFDRIRENLHRPIKGEEFSHLLNRSISQSYARSINTSMTVIVTLLVLLVAGTTTPELKLFCATMLAGIVSGTYSSIYNASPILFLWDRAIGKKKGEEATLLGLAHEEAKKHSVIITQASASPAAAGQVTGASGRTYGQVRRRANSQVKSAQQELDDL